MVFDSSQLIGARGPAKEDAVVALLTDSDSKHILQNSANKGGAGDLVSRL